ncbi:MAG: hypothetical protein DRO06_00295 [Thermoproteota archaeon]|nr:MAG: hypothetical protein DRO06_00295 [Candidatus Korarchaeota archaeon]
MAEEVIADLRHKLGELRARLRQIRDERRKIIEELRGLREERRKLIEEAKAKRKQLRELIAKRNELREKLKELKEERREALERFREARDQAMKLKEQYQSIISEVGVPEKVLRRRIAILERRIETQPLSKDVEREIVMRIGHLEAQLQALIEAKSIRRKYIEAMAEAERWRFFVRDSSERMREIFSEISKLNETISSIIGELDELRSKIDEISSVINEKNEVVDEMKKEMDAIFQEIVETQGKIREIHRGAEEALREVEERILKRLAEEALEKYKAGEKLTLEELRALIEAGYLPGSPQSPQ